MFNVSHTFCGLICGQYGNNEHNKPSDIIERYFSSTLSRGCFVTCFSSWKIVCVCVGWGGGGLRKVYFRALIRYYIFLSFFMIHEYLYIV